MLNMAAVKQLPSNIKGLCQTTVCTHVLCQSYIYQNKARPNGRLCRPSPYLPCLYFVLMISNPNQRYGGVRIAHLTSDQKVSGSNPCCA